MIKKEKEQKDFWDNYVYDRRVKLDHELMRIRQAVDWSFVEAKTKSLYCADNGRPGYHPVLLFRILFLEFYDNLSDVEVVDGLTVNLRYQAFVGIGMDDEIPESTTLVEFRNRLGEEVFKELFSELVKQLKEKGLLSQKVSAIDATHITADIATPSLVNLLRQGRRKMLSRLGREYRKSSEELGKKYPSEPLKPKGRVTEKEIEQERKLTAEFLKELNGLHLKDKEMKLDGEELNKLVMGESGLISFEDKDARWGYKREDKPFAGYKAHVSMDESGIVTGADTFSGEKSESKKELFSKLINEDRAKGLKSECVAADGLYDGAPAQTISEEIGMPIYTPCRHGLNGLEKDYFWFDEAGRFRCRNYSIGVVDLVDGSRKRYSFLSIDCQSCLSKCSCLKKGTIQRSIWLNKCCEASMRQNKELRKAALEQRKRIEAKFGEAKKWHSMERARYRGRWRVAVQVFMTFFVINAKRMVKLMAKSLAPPGSLGTVCLKTV